MEMVRNRKGNNFKMLHFYFGFVSTIYGPKTKKKSVHNVKRFLKRGKYERLQTESTTAYLLKFSKEIFFIFAVKVHKTHNLSVYPFFLKRWGKVSLPGGGL